LCYGKEGLGNELSIIMPEKNSDCFRLARSLTFRKLLIAERQFQIGKLVVLQMALVISKNMKLQIRGEHNAVKMLDSRLSCLCVMEAPDENHAHRHDFLRTADRNDHSW
jgi:hypothetical protein